MPFSKQVVGALAQFLSALPAADSMTLLRKHFEAVPENVWSSTAYFDFIRYAPNAEVVELLEDILVHEAALGVTATPKYRYRDAFAELAGWLKHDGWELNDGKLLSGLPAIEESTEVRDRLVETLSHSALDQDSAIRKCLQKAAEAFQTEPPDLNASTTNVRVALETTARRGARALADKQNDPPPPDSWGSAIHYLRQRQVITLAEEQAVAASYTLISPGAHVPKGMSDIEWARVSRTIALSLTYFLAKQVEAAL